MIVLVKNLFGNDLFESEKFYIKNKEFYIYAIKTNILEEHIYLINLLDKNNLKIKENMKLLNFSEEELSDSE